MMTLGWISAGLTLLGLLVFYLFGDATPSFVIPLVLVSGILAVVFLFVGIIINTWKARRKYHCTKCGTRVTGGKPTRYGSVCPNCGGHVFQS